MRLLLVEDDPLLAEGIKTALNHFNYTLDWIGEGKQTLSALQYNEYSLLILDLGLPDIDGFELLNRIRQKNIDVPVLVLTARSHIDDKVIGLDSGADDYMVKPFDIRELEARIRTLTRRVSGRRTNVIQVGRACLDLNQRVLLFDEQKLTFPRREFSLVHAFFERPRQVFKRESLESLAYNWDEEIESNSLEVHIHRLRKKLGSQSIKTIRGIGYMLVEEHFK
jgi:two-component system response regulator QseB